MKQLLILGLILLPAFAFAQFPQTQHEAEKEYLERIKKDEILGVYIPEDITEAFTELNKKISGPSKEKFKTQKENTLAPKMQYSLGRWIRVNWGFYEGSRLSVYLNKLGLSHPDDMSEFVIISYHRYLTKKPLDTKTLIETLQEEREKKKKKK